jgi:hypothetical protein
VTSEPVSYSGVSCVWCGEPIPVSAKIISLQGQIARGETGVPYAFVARCKMCEYESMYEIRNVQRFDGQPRRPASWGQGVPTAVRI